MYLDYIDINKIWQTQNIIYKQPLNLKLSRQQQWHDNINYANCVVEEYQTLLFYVGVVLLSDHGNEL